MFALHSAPVPDIAPHPAQSVAAVVYVNGGDKVCRIAA